MKKVERALGHDGGSGEKKVVECRGKFLFDIGRPHKGTEANKASKIGLTQGINIGVDVRILANSRGAKPSKIVIKDSIKTWRQLALAGEALHPDAVSDQQVVEGAMQGLEESAAVGAIVSIRHLGGGIIEPFVAPSVIAEMCIRDSA